MIFDLGYQLFIQGRKSLPELMTTAKLKQTVLTSASINTAKSP